MERTRKHFTQDYLVGRAREAVYKKLNVVKSGKNKSKIVVRVMDSVMSGLAMFTFKFPSLLQFDQERESKSVKFLNLRRLFQINTVPCDTYMREVLDNESPSILRMAFSSIFALLQRGGVLKDFVFLSGYYLISLDGTGYFSSNEVYCNQCCVKEHSDGSKTYYHQMLCGALVCPDQKAVFPFAPEPIMKTDGATKNDCELNSAKRWLQDFRREHPLLPAIIIADGLSSNAPFIAALREHKCRFILVCKESNHEYLTQWIKAADTKDAPIIEEAACKGMRRKYQYMNDVPLNDSNQECRVNVVRYWEENARKEIQSKWMWVTDITVTHENVKQLTKGGRSRWRIENETFNTLKNHGYQFEHNFGHGYKNLTTVFAYLMLLAFFIDQCLQLLNDGFKHAYERFKAKYVLWQHMRVLLDYVALNSFEMLYMLIRSPPKTNAAASVAA
jgi:hypothetical protein